MPPAVTSMAAGPVAGLVMLFWLVTLHPHIDTSALRDGMVGTPYADTLQLRHEGDAEWEIRAGPLPPGITLERHTGVLGGTPTKSGKFKFEVRATWRGRRDTEKFEIEIGHRPIVRDIPASDVAEALLGLPNGLDADVRRSLDIQGNDNGSLDIGDLRAYLRLSGDLP